MPETIELYKNKWALASFKTLPTKNSLTNHILPNQLRLLNTPTAFLYRGVGHPNECLGYYVKQSDGETPAMLELWGMRCTPLLPSLPDSLWSGMIAHNIYGSNRTKQFGLALWHINHCKLFYAKSIFIHIKFCLKQNNSVQHKYTI